jgi:hypothetical protein
VLSAQLTKNRKVFRQDGTTLGQGRVSTGEAEETAAVVVLPPAATGDELVTASAGELAAVLGAALVSTVVRVSVTGQMVVETAMVTTVVVTEWAGQFVTVEAHWVMV